MTDPTTRLAAEALTLQAAAEGIHQASRERACAPLVPAALTTIEQTLLILSRTCYAAANSFVPLGAHGESISERYARAADDWPAARDGAGPSHEQQARFLSSLHDAGAALRAAAGHCARAGGNLAVTMDEGHAARAMPSGLGA